MFQFPWFPLPALCVQAGVTRHDPCRVFPFGDPRIEACLAAPRGLSQPATSFIGFQRLGIHRVPFATCRDDARARYGVLKVRRRTVAPSQLPDRSPSAAWFAAGPPAPAEPMWGKVAHSQPSKLHRVPTQMAPGFRPVITASGLPGGSRCQKMISQYPRSWTERSSVSGSLERR
jgi:hypothetical protein